MPERLVDVEKQGSKLLPTFPVTISAPAWRRRRSREGFGGGGQRAVSPERGTRRSERQDACQPRRPTDPIWRSAWRAGGLRWVWTKSFASAPVCFGSKRVGRMAAPTISGIKRSLNASANAPTHCGSGKVAPKVKLPRFGGRVGAYVGLIRP
jgi:hypothetical protein